MSLLGNPLAAFGFGGTGTIQTWQTVIEHIKNKCGVIGTFEYSDEAIVAELKKQVLPFYSIYDGYPEYQILNASNIVSYQPTRIYACQASTQIISIQDVILPEYLYLTNLGEDTLRGFGEVSLDDFLISRNWMDMQRSILPEKTWRFIPPNRLELIDVASSSMNQYIMDIIIRYNTVHPDPSSINPTMFDDFKEMCAGYMMMTIGTMREKTNGLSTPTGTFESNGTTIKQDGVQILETLKQRLVTTPPDTMIYLW